ncbi:MAG: SAM-dependent methyltransferase, partial [Cutibacterium granulosum]
MVDIRQGSWFEPVHDQQFDAIVANPPFVVASQHITHSYRDSSLDLDGATQLMIENAP